VEIDVVARWITGTDEWGVGRILPRGAYLHAVRNAGRGDNSTILAA
jgi:hypothetical protein